MSGMASERGEGSIAEKPLRRFQSLSASMEKLISSIAQDWENAVKDPTRNGEDDGCRLIHLKMRKTQLLFTELHSTARQTHGAIERLRSKVAISKQSMDENHLQLENLLYERDHLSRETQLCRDFTMTELIKMEEDEEQGFLEDVDKLQTEEEHARNLKILTDQKDKRKRSQLELEQTQIRVKGVNSAISDSKQYLSKLPDSLKDVEKALMPLKKNMPWRAGARRGRHEQAADLPGPLFILYCQLEAYCDFILDEEGGEEDNAASLSLVAYEDDRGTNPPSVTVTLAPSNAYVSASAKAAAEEPDSGAHSAKGDRRLISKGTSMPHGPAAAKRARLIYREENEDLGLAGGGDKRMISKCEAGRLMLDALKPSPLEVVLTLTISNADGPVSIGNNAANGGRLKGKRSKNGGGIGPIGKDASSFTVRFSYLPALGIITACPQPGFPRSLLVNLFPNDTGRDTPNPSNHHNQAARASASGIFEFPSDVPCRPYLWAQWLTGLHFPSAAEGVNGVGAVEKTGKTGREGGKKEKGPIEPSTRTVMSVLRSRLRTHASVAGQLRKFSSKGLSPSTLLQDEVLEATGNIELRSWKELSGSDLEQAAKGFQERDVSTAGDMEDSVPGASGALAGRKAWERHGARYFNGTLKIKKGKGKERAVEMQVELPAEYPLRPSLISLMEKGNSTVQEELRTISNEVNSHYDTLLPEDVTSWDQLLSKQISLVMECLIARPVGGFGRLRRGRMRRKPVMFDRLERTFVHR